MSTQATSHGQGAASPTNKGKGKDAAGDISMESQTTEGEEEEDSEEEEDDDDDDDDEEGEDEEEEGNSNERIDPSAILPRRTRGVKVDYSSPEALAKAGIQKADLDKDEDDDEEMKAA